MHAALADPTRLAIVDILSVGDASASRLSAQLGVPSNLLAHHLGILQSADVVMRRQSEGDRRRTYWRLVHTTLATLAMLAAPVPTGRSRPARVVFVCTANSARSHLAAALWPTVSGIPATSAGTRPAARISPGARASARRHGTDLPDARPQHLDDVAGHGDLVVTVCDRAHEELGDRSRVHWSVPDPVPEGTRTAFDRAYDELAARVDHLAPRLEPAS